jgi:hypothetical protein
MSMRPQPWPEPNEEIAAAVRAMYPGGKVPLPVAIRDQLGELFTDEELLPRSRRGVSRGAHQGGSRWSRCYRWPRT